jgi:hypothetical protein
MDVVALSTLTTWLTFSALLSRMHVLNLQSLDRADRNGGCHAHLEEPMRFQLRRWLISLTGWTHFVGMPVFDRACPGTVRRGRIAARLEA